MALPFSLVPRICIQPVHPKRAHQAPNKFGIKVVSIVRKPTTGVGVGGFDSCRGHQRRRILPGPGLEGTYPIR